MRVILALAYICLSLACGSPDLEARTMVLSDDGDEVTQVVPISISNMPEKEKFSKILRLALGAKGGKRGGPDVAFSKRPNWYTYLVPFIENAESYGSFGPYRGADLAFLKRWSQAKKYDEFRNRLVELGYLDDRGMPKRSSIRNEDLDGLNHFALVLYDK